MENTVGDEEVAGHGARGVAGQRGPLSGAPVFPATVPCACNGGGIVLAVDCGLKKDVLYCKHLGYTRK